MFPSITDFITTIISRNIMACKNVCKYIKKKKTLLMAMDQFNQQVFLPTLN